MLLYPMKNLHSAFAGVEWGRPDQQLGRLLVKENTSKGGKLIISQ